MPAIAEVWGSFDDNAEVSLFSVTAELSVHRRTAASADSGRTQFSIVKVQQRGYAGWGECPARPHTTRETHARHRAVIGGIRTGQVGARAIAHAPGHEGFALGLESAIVECRAQESRVSLFGPAARPVVTRLRPHALKPHGWLGLSAHDGPREWDRSLALCDRLGLGAGMKCKLDANMDRTQRLVKWLGSVAGQGRSWDRIILDANGSLERESAATVVKWMEKSLTTAARFVIFEQPVRMHDLSGLCDLAELSSRVVIAADESVSDAGAATRLVRGGCFVNIKPHRFGRLASILEIADAVRMAGGSYWLGSTLGLPLLGVSNVWRMLALRDPLWLDACPSALFMTAAPITPLDAEIAVLADLTAGSVVDGARWPVLLDEAALHPVS